MNCLKRLQRFWAGIITVAFFVTNTLTPAPIAHAMPDGRQAANVESPAFISSFKLVFLACSTEYIRKYKLEIENKNSHLELSLGVMEEVLSIGERF